jgi:ABC-2 type transport system ATP-binding protein
MIEVEHLSKIYGSTVAIQDIDFSVNTGEILGFLGPNGAGKTTTMRILAGYIPATSGTARIAGYDVHEQSMQVRQRIGYLPENPPLYPDMTVEGFMHFVAQIKGIAAGDRIDRVNSAIGRTQLTQKRKVPIRKLSKGYRQRVGIAQAIVHDPPAIVLDEPTVGLDPKQIIEVRHLIKSLAGRHTVILSTHILPEVSMTCDRAIVIDRGQVVATDLPADPTAERPVKSRYEIEVDGDITPILPQLQKISALVEMKLHDPHHLSLLAQPGQEIGQEIAAIIVNSGLGLLEMRRDRPTLEDVFLEVIGTGEVK